MTAEKQLQEIRTLFKKHGQYSQGLKALGIEGRRDSDFRYQLYNLDSYIKESFDVLDIGCNCGFFSCLLAQRVNHVRGIDKDETLIQIANIASDLMRTTFKTHFICADFKTFDGIKQYDLVIASQIHYWVNMSFAKYAEKATGMVKKGGFLLFESHDIDTVDKDLTCKMCTLSHNGLVTVYSGDYVEDPGQYWIPPKAHKKIPRKFYLMQKI